MILLELKAFDGNKIQKGKHFDIYLDLVNNRNELELEFRSHVWN